MPRLTHPLPQLVYACPECDRAGDVYRQTDETDVCHNCGATDIEPVERVSRGEGSGGDGYDDATDLPSNLNPEAKAIIRELREVES